MAGDPPAARTLGDLMLAASERYRDDVAFEIRRGLRRERVTYAQAADLARRFAGWSAAQGLVPGDRVAVWAPNMPEYAVLYFGAWLAGLAVVPLDIRTRQDALSRVLVASAPRIAFRSRQIAGSMDPVRDVHALEDLFGVVGASPPIARPPVVDPEALCEIAYTSGTTGEPKGVALTHANLVASVDALREAFPLRRGIVALSVLPLSHIYELTVTFVHGYASGARVVYLHRVNAATIARAMSEARVEAVVAVPELLRLMLRAIERRARSEGRWWHWRLAHRIAPVLPVALRRAIFGPVLAALGGRLELVGVGGAPLDVPVARAWERMGVQVFEGYGLTETSGAVTINARGRARLGTAGRMVPGVELRFAPDGEILVRGPTVTRGYFGDPAGTARAFSDGWLRTGDVGRFDRDGFLHVTGRTAFRIVLPDGRKVYPEDVEAALNAEDGVRDSCVIGLKDDQGRERVHAVLLTDAPDRADTLVRSANARLEDHQQIRTWSIWPEPDLPRGPTLKADRAVVRGIVERRVAPPPGPAGPVTATDVLTSVIARATGRPPAVLRDGDMLEADLGLDSIGRVELLSTIEDELGVAIDELRVGPRLTVGALRGLIAEQEAAAEGAPRVEKGARWPRSWWARLAGDALFWVACRIQDRWLSLEIVHGERVVGLPMPSLLVFNYQAPYAAVAVLRAVPRRLRHRIAVAADADAWARGRRWQGWIAALAVQAFPMVKSGGAVRGSLDEAGRWLDDGYAILLSPEGGPSMGEEAGPFLRGIGVLAVDARVPIVPLRLEGYSSLYPRAHVPFPWLPERQGRARLVVGEPVEIPRGATYGEASELARRAVIEAT